MAFSKKSLGKQLALLRAQAGLSQRDCARALEVTDKAVSKWETGAAFPSMDSMVRIAELYGIGLSELFAGAEGGRGQVVLVAVEGEASCGKDTALQEASDQLEMKGYRVIRTGNTAAGLARAGARRGFCDARALCTQAVLLQVAHEEAAISAARSMNAGKAVVLCDGSVMDARHGATAVDFTVALRAAGISEEQALARYDARVAWHEPRPGETAGAQALAAQVLQLLGEGSPFGEERVLLVRRPVRTLLDAQPGARRCAVSLDFVADGKGALHALESRDESEPSAYLLDGSPIDERSHDALRKLASPDAARVEKERWSIPGSDLFTCVDCYPFMPYTALARVRTASPAGTVSAPSFLSVVREVTGSSRFSEQTFARELKLGRI